MKIEPVGINRDRQIAELRGDRPDTICGLVGGECPYPVNELCRLDCKHVIIEPQVNPYSTDIASAMELLDGMRYEYAEIEITHLRTDEQWLIRPFKEDSDIIHDDFAFEVREPTLQGAISEAWLRHKGGDNG